MFPLKVVETSFEFMEQGTANAHRHSFLLGLLTSVNARGSNIFPKTATTGKPEKGFQSEYAQVKILNYTHDYENTLDSHR